MAKLALPLGRYDVIHAGAERCLDIARRMRDRRSIAHALELRGIAFLVTGNPARARRTSRSAAKWRDRSSDGRAGAMRFTTSRKSIVAPGDLVEAETLYRESLASSRARDGDAQGCGATLLGLAVMLRRHGIGPPRCARRFAESVEIERANGCRDPAAQMLDVTATARRFASRITRRLRASTEPRVARMRDARSQYEPVDVRVHRAANRSAARRDGRRGLRRGRGRRNDARATMRRSPKR